MWEKDGLTIKEISGITGLAKSSLTSMFERMRDKGLICINVNPGDRRSKIVTLSSGAKELEKEFDLVTNSMFENYYKGFSEAEVVQFENQLRRILKNLEEAK